jgi:hypothetical protein
MYLAMYSRLKSALTLPTGCYSGTDLRSKEDNRAGTTVKSYFRVVNAKLAKRSPQTKSALEILLTAIPSSDNE